ncbi:MAG: glycosyltransferase [Pseudomonadota bacterium]
MTTRTAFWQATLDKQMPSDTAPSRGIPRLLHQIYFPGMSQLPTQVISGIDILRGLNPDWDYRFYDQQAGEAFVGEVYGADILAVYRKIDPEYYAARADLLRYLLCYARGGVYLDIKSVARRPLSEVLRAEDAFILSQWDDLKHLSPNKAVHHPAAHAELRHIKGYEYVQWFVVAAPRHPFLKAVIASVLSGIDQYNVFSQGVGRMGVLRLTGPIAYTLAIDPLRGSAPYRMAAFEDELGFEFSVYGDHKQHRSAFGTHYSQKTLPVVKSNYATTQAARAWFGLVHPYLDRVKQIVQPKRKKAP